MKEAASNQKQITSLKVTNELEDAYLNAHHDQEFTPSKENVSNLFERVTTSQEAAIIVSKEMA